MLSWMKSGQINNLPLTPKSGGGYRKFILENCKKLSQISKIELQ